jgi:hypothetical protein
VEEFATAGISRIHDERHIKLPLPNSRNVVCRCAFQKLNRDIRVT